MPRIQGIDIPNEKKARISLTYMYGIGQFSAEKMLAALNIEGDIKAKDLSDEELVRIAEYIDKNLITEGHLRRQIASNVQRLKEIGCYRGLRHRRSLPVNGQRTRSNARSRKGPKKTVAGKKGTK